VLMSGCGSYVVISPLHVARLGGNSPDGVSPYKPCRRSLASRCASLFDVRDLLSIHYLSPYHSRHVILRLLRPLRVPELCGVVGAGHLVLLSIA
jgi:hypothetical protein